MIFTKERISNICIHNLKPLWLSTPEEFPVFLESISPDAKALNTEFMQSSGHKMSIHFNKFHSRKVKWFSYSRRHWIQKAERLLMDFFRGESILNMGDYLPSETISCVNTELKKFLYSAREFAPDLTVTDLGQAVRNYLVYAMFLELSSKEQCYTPAIFGYSMLYPVTDNYIDSTRSKAEKQSYNAMIRDKIKGLPVCPISPHEKQTCELLSCIESFYGRDTEKNIYAGLALMLEAQQESLEQQAKEHCLSAERRLEISLYKGGISVLIDRYLADSQISDEDLRFYLGFGFILQLADDLQDISSDLQEGNQTLFDLKEAPGTLEALVNRLLNFIDRLFCSYQSPNEHFQIFLRQSCIYLILMSTQMSKEHFHEDYLQNLERCFPVPFSLLDQYTKNSALYPKGMDEKDLLQGMDLFLRTHTF